MLFLVTTFFAILYTFFVYLLGLILYFTKFYETNEPKAFCELFSTSLLCLLVWLLVFGLKKVVTSMHKEVGKYERNRNNLLVGLGFIAGFSIWIRIDLFNVGKYGDNPLYLFLLTTVIAAFYFIFVHGPSKKCKWDLTSSRLFQIYFCVVLIANFVGIYVPVVKAIGHRDQVPIIIYQIAFGLIGTSSSLEVLTILMGKLRLKTEMMNAEAGTAPTTTRSIRSMRSATPGSGTTSTGGYSYCYN